MSLWWLQSGWKSARCACGRNIWDAGGDPDIGECPECFEESHREYPQEPPPVMPKCDICGVGEACADVAGKAVCSAECAARAAREE